MANFSEHTPCSYVPASDPGCCGRSRWPGTHPVCFTNIANFKNRIAHHFAVNFFATLKFLEYEFSRKKSKQIMTISPLLLRMAFFRNRFKTPQSWWQHIRAFTMKQNSSNTNVSEYFYFFDACSLCFLSFELLWTCNGFDLRNILHVENLLRVPMFLSETDGTPLIAAAASGDVACVKQLLHVCWQKTHTNLSQWMVVSMQLKFCLECWMVC